MRPPNDIVSELVSRLQALQWTPDSGPAEPAFGSVLPFDSTDLADAFSTLLASKQRVALVVYTGESYETERGIRLSVRRTVSVSLVISDRVIGKKNHATFGGPTNPGAIRLVSLVLPAITGRIIPNPEGIDCVPVRADLLDIDETTKKLPNRVACLLDLDCFGGAIDSATQVAPTR